MALKLVKCPRCDLNYITETEKFCKVCLRDLKGEVLEDENELCSVCGEEPCMPGKDVCYTCYKEMNNMDDSDMERDGMNDAPRLEMDSVSTMDEIAPDIDEEPTTPEEAEISLESVAEEEAEDEEDEEEEI